MKHLRCQELGGAANSNHGIIIVHFANFVSFSSSPSLPFFQNRAKVFFYSVALINFSKKMVLFLFRPPSLDFGFFLI